jgi:hypothetical protein
VSDTNTQASNPDTMLPICAKCKYYHLDSRNRPPIWATCTAVVNVVTGTSITTCLTSRESDKLCGVTGKWFEEKPVVEEKPKRWFQW